MKILATGSHGDSAAEPRYGNIEAPTYETAPDRAHAWVPEDWDRLSVQTAA